MLYPDSSFSFWIDIVLICVAFAVISTILIFILKFILDKSVPIFPWLWSGHKRDKIKNEPVEMRIHKRAGIKPDKVVVYGQNTFASDSRKKKIFIQTYMEPDGILLDYKDIVSFETFEHSDADNETQCGELTLKIRTSKKGYAEIVLPYITSPEDRSGFIYTSASDAAKDVKAVLEGI